MIFHNLNYDKNYCDHLNYHAIIHQCQKELVDRLRYSFEQFFRRTTLKTPLKTAGDDRIRRIFLATSVSLGNLLVSGLKNSNASMLLYKRLKFY